MKLLCAGVNISPFALTPQIWIYGANILEENGKFVHSHAPLKYTLVMMEKTCLWVREKKLNFATLSS